MTVWVSKLAARPQHVGRDFEEGIEEFKKEMHEQPASSFDDDRFRFSASRVAFEPAP